ncbi:hypothetical protein [Pararhizobium haloflavum]|uniref:hypothetical protein n=1 Tax=Pararhizobium haloflavum TaxID=2037914 RepID=UPI001FE0A837|nr:hypothetical protein [Pararhizobium haloflavum]
MSKERKCGSIPPAMTLDWPPQLWNGDAADWSLDLSADLADRKAGRIDWSEIDLGVLLSGPPDTLQPHLPRPARPILL